MKDQVSATVVLISGCQDDQTSLDGDRNGAFTGALRDVWSDGSFRELARVPPADPFELPATQNPNYSREGSETKFRDRAAVLALTPVALGERWRVVTCPTCQTENAATAFCRKCGTYLRWNDRPPAAGDPRDALSLQLAADAVSVTPGARRGRCWVRNASSDSREVALELYELAAAWSSVEPSLLQLQGRRRGHACGSCRRVTRRPNDGVA